MKIKYRSLFLLSSFLLTVSSCQEETTNGFVPVQGLLWNRIFVDTFQDLNDIQCINVNAGWIVGENRTMISTNSGDLGWNIVPVNFPVENLNSVFFIDNDLGWMVGDLSETTPQGQVAYTTTGGGYPLQQHIAENPLNSLFFTDELKGWAAGENGILIQTIDGGKNWTSLVKFTQQRIYDLYFLDETSGWAATANGDLFFTTDGVNWLLSETGTDTDLLSVQFIDKTYGWACGFNNTLLKGTAAPDNTIIWERIEILPEPPDMIWHDIFFIDEFKGWVVGEFGKIYHTEDGGVTWVEEESTVSTSLNGIFMVSDRKGWAIGDNGVIISYNPE